MSEPKCVRLGVPAPPFHCFCHTPSHPFRQHDDVRNFNGVELETAYDEPEFEAASPITHGATMVAATSGKGRNTSCCSKICATPSALAPSRQTSTHTDRRPNRRLHTDSRTPGTEYRPNRLGAIVGAELRFGPPPSDPPTDLRQRWPRADPTRLPKRWPTAAGPRNPARAPARKPHA